MLNMLPLTVLLTLFTITPLSWCRRPEQQVLRQDVIQEVVDDGCTDPSAPFRVQFESGEHMTLGDSLVLHYPGGVNITGNNFNYNLAGTAWSFGAFVTLGDFYSTQQNIGPCQASISDPQLTWQQRLDLFTSITTAFLSGVECSGPNCDPAASNVFTCYMNIVNAENIATAYAPDPAQCYANRNAGVPDGWDAQFALCTPFPQATYAAVALCNPDHFMHDAATAYAAGHTVALQAAYKAKDSWDLKDAYFQEAFAQHYLSDLFSAGHLRTPRRSLHVDPTGIRLDYPADTCNRHMHDEDSANGLWVSNGLGESWPLYGDKQLLSAKSYVNRQFAIRAMQAGADELLTVFNTRTMIDPSNYTALRMAPDSSLIPTYQNYVPMFNISSGPTGSSLLQRAVLDDRSNPSTQSYDLNQLQTQDSWSPIETPIANSAIMTDMYPRTIQGFALESNMTQVRILNSTHFLLNQYGPTWTTLFDWVPNQTAQRSWNMLAQFVGPSNLDEDLDSISWTWSEKIADGDNIYAMLGLSPSNKQSVLVGVQALSTSTGGTTTNVLRPLWKSINPDPLGCTPSFSSVAYGNFSTSSAPSLYPAVVQQCVISDGSSILQAWNLSSPQSAPTLLSPPLKSDIVSLQRHLFSVPVSGADSNPELVVEVAYYAANSSNLWSFTRWTNGYTNRQTTTFWEGSNVGGANVKTTYLVDTSTVSKLIRVVSSSTGITTDIVTLKDDGQTVTPTVIYSQTFAVQVPNDSTQDFFLLDSIASPSPSESAGLGLGPSLVMYCTSASASEIDVSVFARSGTSSATGNGDGFQPPQTTTIPGTYRAKFNGAFSKYVLAAPGVVWDPRTQQRVGTGTTGTGYQGVVQLFDNYGILGARLIAPATNSGGGGGSGSGDFMPWGQYPAIAGQSSHGLEGAGSTVGFMFH